MDEVDFTILAATSVLGDLIEKCPPAEACRDAFDRMSKATVQMCMSTTGFGSSGQGLSSINAGEYFTSTNHTAPRPSTRPKPHFDMALNDLLGPSDPARPRPQQMTTHAATKSPEYPTSPGQSRDPSSIDPGIVPYAHQQAGPSYPAPGSPYAESPFAPTGPGMDLLQGSGWENDVQGGIANGGNGGFAALGDNLSWDHDFSDLGNGGMPDLFEGFFFGGSGSL